MFMFTLPYLTRVPYHVDVGCYLTIQTKLLYLLSGGSILLVSFLSSFAGTSGRFPSGGPELSCLLHSMLVTKFSISSLRMTCPKTFTCLFTISLISFPFVFALRRTSTFVTCSVYEILWVNVKRLQ